MDEHLITAIERYTAAVGCTERPENDEPFYVSEERLLHIVEQMAGLPFHHVIGLIEAQVVPTMMRLLDFSGASVEVIESHDGRAIINAAHNTTRNVAMTCLMLGWMVRDVQQDERDGVSLHG